MRQRVLKEPLTQRSIQVYRTDWDEFGEILAKNGSNISFFVRNVIESELKKERRRNKDA